MELEYCKIGLRYSIICQGTSTKWQRRDLFGFGIKLLLVTTSLSTEIKAEAIPLSGLQKDATSELAGLPSHYPFILLYVKQGSCEHRQREAGGRGLPGFSYMIPNR